MSNKLIILSGAGLSADSGVPTFRSANGLWMGHDINKVCNYLTWKDNFSLVHGFYNQLRTLLSRVEPNLAHRTIAQWETLYGDRIINMTANVDDLLERAGCKNVLHLHGFLPEMQCTACGNIWTVGHSEWNCDEDRCPKCTSKKGVKPAVVFFNEGATGYSRLNKVFREIVQDDVVLIIGTSGQVINVDAYLFDKSCFKILNNLQQETFVDDTMYDSVHFASASDAIQEIDTIVRGRMK
jgi:NAD-dependent deacetylase